MSAKARAYAADYTAHLMNLAADDVKALMLSRIPGKFRRTLTQINWLEVDQRAKRGPKKLAKRLDIAIDEARDAITDVYLEVYDQAQLEDMEAQDGSID